MSHQRGARAARSRVRCRRSSPTMSSRQRLPFAQRREHRALAPHRARAAHALRCVMSESSFSMLTRLRACAPRVRRGGATYLNGGELALVQIVVGHARDTIHRALGDLDPQAARAVRAPGAARIGRKRCNVAQILVHGAGVVAASLPSRRRCLARLRTFVTGASTAIAARAAGVRPRTSVSRVSSRAPRRSFG